MPCRRPALRLSCEVVGGTIKMRPAQAAQGRESFGDGHPGPIGYIGIYYYE